MSNFYPTSVEVRLRNAVSDPAQTTVNATAAQLLAANGSRRGLIVQNTGATVIYLGLGTATVTASAYHVALAACTNANDGLGGIYLDESWTGAVQAISSADGGTCVVGEVE